MKMNLLLISIVAVLTNCNNALELDEPISQYSVLMNGEPWEDYPPTVTNDQVLQPVKKIQGFYSNDCQDSTINITMKRGNYDSNSYNLELLKLNKIPNKTGKYQCIKKTLFCHQDTLVYSNFTPLIGDDVLGEIYKTIDTEDNYILIESLDNRLGIMGGKFQVSFLNVNDDKDTVRFTDGTFRVLLFER